MKKIARQLRPPLDARAGGALRASQGIWPAELPEFFRDALRHERQRRSRYGGRIGHNLRAWRSAAEGSPASPA